MADFSSSETLQSSPERQTIVDFVTLPNDEAINFDGEKLRGSLASLAKEIRPDGSEVESDTGNGVVSMRWAGSGKDKSAPACLFVEGRTGGKFRSITFPIVDWGTDLPTSAISFSLIADGEGAIHMPNSKDLSPANPDKDQVNAALNGVKWMAGNLLDWKSGHPQIPSKVST